MIIYIESLSTLLRRCMYEFAKMQTNTTIYDQVLHWHATSSFRKERSGTNTYRARTTGMQMWVSILRSEHMSRNFKKMAVVICRVCGSDILKQ